MNECLFEKVLLHCSSGCEPINLTSVISGLGTGRFVYIAVSLPKWLHCQRSDHPAMLILMEMSVLLLFYLVLTINKTIIWISP